MSIVYDVDMLIFDNSDIDKTTELVTLITLLITVFKFRCSGQNEPYLKSNVHDFEYHEWFNSYREIFNPSTTYLAVTREKLRESENDILYESMSQHDWG